MVSVADKNALESGMSWTSVSNSVSMVRRRCSASGPFLVRFVYKSQLAL